MPIIFRFYCRSAAACLVWLALAAPCADTYKPALSGHPSALHWHPSGHTLTYLKASDKPAALLLMSFDPDSGTEKSLLNFADLPAADTPNAKALRPRDFEWLPSGNEILVRRGTEAWIVTPAEKLAKQLAPDFPEKHSLSVSPDGKLLAFVSANDLYTVSIETGLTRRLTTDGSATILNATLDWVYEEEFRESNPSHRAYAWSPDSRAIVYLRLDQSLVPIYPITDFLSTHPTLNNQRYPKSGDSNSAITVCAVDLTPELHTHRMELPADAAYVVPEFSWSPDSRSAAVTILNRAQNKLTLCSWSPAAAGAPKVLFSESDPAWINVAGAPIFLPDGRFIALSERDGWMHAYLYSADGAKFTQLTQGPWMIDPENSFGGFPTIDAGARYLYFSSTLSDPRRRQICRVPLNSAETKVEALTTENGLHFSRLSPDGTHLLEKFSSATQPAAYRILRGDGTLRAELYRAGAPREKPPFEFHECKAKDGTLLYAKLLKPENFDPAKKYPVVVAVYGGPHLQMVLDSSSGSGGFADDRLAREGYLLWILDNRGSYGRGHAWEKTIYKDLGRIELSDQLDGIAYLKTLPFVDPQRFGIYGWSYGGYMTLYALTHAPKAFKCGAAGAPVADWRFYDTIYTERYMSTPAENPAGYRSSSPLAAAANLEAKLLLIHGTSDDNVHMQNTLNFIHALIESGRPCELQLYPGEKHGFRGTSSWTSLSDRTIEFFKRNL